jgi:V8-like Glu-specific endopeptidase
MRFGPIRTALLATLAVGCGAGMPGEGGNEGSTEQPIAGGVLDTTDTAVFEEVTNWTSDVSTCTANLIAPNVLLTARHCVAATSSEKVVCASSTFGDTVDPAETVATGDAVLRDTSTFYRGLDVHVPTTGNDMCGYDVALIVLSTPVPASQVTPLIPRIDQPVQQGESYTAVGYGLNAQGQENPGRMVLDNRSVQCVGDQCALPYGVAPTEFLGDTGICSGDSGGPALDADGKVIGIVSRGSDPCATPVYSQVAPWSDFITQTVIAAATAGGYQAPFWAYSGSSDAPPDALGVGDHCGQTSDCYPGLVCYYQGNSANAKCTQVCGSSTQCASGEQCTLGYQVPGGGLCLNTPTNAEQLQKADAAQSCSLRTGGAPSGDATRFAVLGLIFAFWSRRRPRPRATH